jgi:hypothetical protein
VGLIGTVELFEHLLCFISPEELEEEKPLMVSLEMNLLRAAM